MTGSAFDATCLTTHVPGVVAENRFTNCRYIAAAPQVNPSCRPHRLMSVAMSFALVPSLHAHTDRSQEKENDMPATYTFDVFSSLDGYGAASANWTGYWGKQGPELLDHRLALYGEEQRMVFGANTFRAFVQMLASS